MVYFSCIKVTENYDWPPNYEYPLRCINMNGLDAYDGMLVASWCCKTDYCNDLNIIKKRRHSTSAPFSSGMVSLILRFWINHFCHYFVLFFFRLLIRIDVAQSKFEKSFNDSVNWQLFKTKSIFRECNELIKTKPCTHLPTVTDPKFWSKKWEMWDKSCY